VEEKRGTKIPAWAYRDVLFMLIDYSIRAYELLERRLTAAEKEETFAVFYTIGARMGLEELPVTYNGWLIMRKGHLQQNLISSHFTKHLYLQYKKHLGFTRYWVLKQAQLLVAPASVRRLASLPAIPFLLPVVQVYKFARMIKIDGLMKNAILPRAYKLQVQNLDVEL
jgi:hypothetical protein